MNGMDILDRPPSQDSSHHQDYCSLVENLNVEPSFATGIMGYSDFAEFAVASVTPQGTNISHQKSLLKRIFIFPRWDMIIPWRVNSCMLCNFGHPAGVTISLYFFIKQEIINPWRVRVGIFLTPQKKHGGLVGMSRELAAYTLQMLHGVGMSSLLVIVRYPLEVLGHNFL